MTKQTRPRKKAEERNRVISYRVGNEIYLPSELYLSHGGDDFDGGLCKIVNTGNDNGWKWIEVRENPGKRYSLNYVSENQKKWRKEYGNQRGKKNPDYSFDSNCWACPGDIVGGKVIDHYIP